jgi:chromosome segregation ATPase
VELEAEAVKQQMTLQADVSNLQEQLLSLQRELLSTQDNLSLSSSALQESVARNEGLDSELAFLNARVDEASTQISGTGAHAVLLPWFLSHSHRQSFKPLPFNLQKKFL